MSYLPIPNLIQVLSSLPMIHGHIQARPGLDGKQAAGAANKFWGHPMVPE